MLEVNIAAYFNGVAPPVGLAHISWTFFFLTTLVSLVKGLRQ